jgi:hypothetical protein
MNLFDTVTQIVAVHNRVRHNACSPHDGLARYLSGNSLDQLTAHPVYFPMCVDACHVPALHGMGEVYPDLPIQRCIASILSGYDDLIENNIRRIKILEDMAQMIYREWFVNFRFPGHEKARIVDSELGPIPDGWQTGILRDVCDSMDYGYTASANLEPIGPKFLRITDIVPPVIDWHSVPHCAAPEKNADRYALRGAFNGNRFFNDSNRQVNYMARIRKIFDKEKLTVGASVQLGKQLLPPGYSRGLVGCQPAANQDGSSPHRRQRLITNALTLSRG